MQTALDDAKTWFLKSLEYSGELEIVIVEGIVSQKPEDVQICGVEIKNTHRVEPGDSSRLFMIRFVKVVAWQAIDESYTSGDPIRPGVKMRFLKRPDSSAYLDYIKVNHGWFAEVAGPAHHYQLFTEDVVIDVVAHDEPAIEQLANEDDG